jgi:hypothetical protein
MKTMKCECGKEIDYDYNYQCYDCICGNCYNVMGQELAPKSNWEDDYDNEDLYTDDNY